MKWIEVDTKINGYGRDIIFVDGRYYLAHTDPSGIAYSDDLVNWNDILLDSDKVEISNLAYGNGIFLATGGAGKTKSTYIYLSENGTDWFEKEISSSVNFSMNCNTCKFINNQFVFTTGYVYSNSAGETTSVVIEINITKNGKDFTKHIYKINTNKNYYVMDIDYENGLYVLIGEDGFIATSPDLKNWTQRDSGVTETLVGIAHGKNKFVVTGSNGIILTSEDGINWKRQSSNTTSYLIRSRYANGLYMAVGYNGTILTSLDANIWSEEEDPFFRTVIYGLVFAENKFVISAGRYSATQTIPISYCEVSRELTISKDDSLYVYDKNLNFLGVIDEFISLIWRRKYYEAGDFELVVAPYKNNINLLKKDNIIMRRDYTEAALIDTLEIIDDKNNVDIKISGKFLSYVTHRRIIKKKINYSGPVIDGMKKIIQEMTPISKKFEIEPTTIPSNKMEFQVTYQNVYDYQVKLSKISNIGFRIVPNVETKVFRYENYVGLNRTKEQKVNERYCFSTIHKNIEKINIIDTSILKCNYVLVGGQGEEENRILVEVKEGETEGFDLFESFIDAKSESNPGLTPEQYRSVLTTKGQEALSDETITIDTTSLALDYKKKWDLGDIVDVWIEDYDINIQKRIVEVEEAIENGTKSICPVFGNPLPEKMDLDVIN